MNQCANCGVEGGASLKACRACMQARYCNAACQKKHWASHKIPCKIRAAELRDEALFKDPPPKEDCPICFLPMPAYLITCVSLSPATRSSVPIYDFAIANKQLTNENTEKYFTCCGKSICRGCMYSFCESGNKDNCPFCNSDQGGKTEEHIIEEIRKRVLVNDPSSIFLLAGSYHHGFNGLQQDQAKAIELWTRAAELGYSKAHWALGLVYRRGGDMKKANFHFEAAAMAGDEVARLDLGNMEAKSGNIERAFKHWTIAASAGDYDAMNALRKHFKKGLVTRESINSSLTAYNNSCVEMRSEARDTYLRKVIKGIGGTSYCLIQLKSDSVQ